MGIKETPTNFRVYYTSMRKAYTQKKEDAAEARIELLRSIKLLREEVENAKSLYKESFDVDIDKYEEYTTNTYINGKFLRVARGMFMNKSNNYELTSDLYCIYKLAIKQKDLYLLDKDVEFYDKMLAIPIKEYSEILRIYYSEVQKHLILNGEGYVFDNNIGWLCINRCRIEQQRTLIDFKKTKERKAQLLAEGKRLYNKEEAKWCEEHGIPYDGVDGRVFMRNEYCYELPLCDCKLPHGTKFKFEVSDYRHASLRGRSNEDLIRDCHNDINEICNLKVDLRLKLNLCLKADDTLYSKFIRNENQKPTNAGSFGRKNRQ